MLNLANVRPGGRYIAVDDASGIVVAGILERLGGQGRLMTICDVDTIPTYPLLEHMAFEKEMVAPVLSSLNWATADEEYSPVSSEVPTGGAKTERQLSRLTKRKVASDALMNTREELFDGDFDGLLIASEYDTLSILEKLSPYLAGSASIVVHSPFIQVVTDLQIKLREWPQYLGPAVTESWLRRYQILPGRTHPTMSTSGSGGYLLHVTKVYDDPGASSVLFNRKKKAKLDRERIFVEDST